MRLGTMCALAALSAGSAYPAFAQNYPAKPVRIMTAGVGGGNDAISRIIAQGISGPLGQPVIVDNRAGIIGGELLARAPADGYTLLLHGASMWLAPFLQTNVPYDPLKDFAPITIL